MNNNSKRLRLRNQEISNITKEIGELTERLNQLTTEQNQELEQQEEHIQLRDLVEITNNYRGQKGLRGEVIKLTSKQVVIRVENTNKRLVKLKRNVRKVDPFQLK